MSKELTIDQAIGEATAIDRDKSIVLAAAAVVYGAGDHLFPGACFTLDQYRCLDSCQFIDKTRAFAQMQETFREGRYFLHSVPNSIVFGLSVREVDVLFESKVSKFG